LVAIRPDVILGASWFDCECYLDNRLYPQPH